MTERNTPSALRRAPWPLMLAILLAIAGALAWVAGLHTATARAVTLVAAGIAIGQVLARVRVQRQDEHGRDRQEQTTQTLSAELAAKTILLQEIHHRVKNQLAMISSLLNIKAQLTTSPDVRDALRASRHRLESIALIHEHLHRGEHMDRVQFARYGQELVDELRAALLDDASPIRIETAFDPIELPIEQAVPCALVLNELVTNALKHAFPGGRRGTICLSLREAMPGMLELTVADDGVGSAHEPGSADADSASLGLRIVSLLTGQLGGTVQHRRGPGTAVVLRFPRMALARVDAAVEMV